ISNACDCRPARNVDWFAQHATAKLLRLLHRRAQVADLDVQYESRMLACHDVARDWLWRADAGSDLHNRTVADLPVEHLSIELANPLRIPRLDLPVHHRSCPILFHGSSNFPWRRQLRATDQF